MTMGPWIHVLSIVTVDQTDLDQHVPLAEEELPQIIDLAKCPGGTLEGQAAPLWGWPAGPSGPKASCHVHLSPCVHICHLFAYFFYQISCIQINLYVQVELGEL
jgi:hypothetical protein